MVIGADNTAQRKDVVTGASDANGFAIKRGVKPGEMVITLSAAALKEGQPVRAGGAKGDGGGKGGGAGGAYGKGGAPAGG